MECTNRGVDLITAPQGFINQSVALEQRKNGWYYFTLQRIRWTPTLSISSTRGWSASAWPRSTGAALGNKSEFALSTKASGIKLTFGRWFGHALQLLPSCRHTLHRWARPLRREHLRNWGEMAAYSRDRGASRNKIENKSSAKHS